jgi:hypothetical protein
VRPAAFQPTDRAAIDRIYPSSEVQVNDQSSSVSYAGGWTNHPNEVGAISDDTHASSNQNASASFTFTGTSIRVWLQVGPNSGTADIYVDGYKKASYNSYRPVKQHQVAAYVSTGLANKQHTVKVVNAVGGKFTTVDAFSYLPSGGGGGGGGGSGSSTSFEAESLAITHNGGTLNLPTNTAASGGQYSVLWQNGLGSWIAYQVPVPSGTYAVSGVFRKSWSRGIFQLAVDGTNLGQPKDLYAATAAFVEVPLGTRTFTAGTKSFRFTAVGKNASTNYYEFALDKLILRPSS